MNKYFLRSTILLTFCISHATFGIENTSVNKSKTEKSKSQSMEFKDLLVQGKYHFSDEAVITVEKDKVLDGLLDVRKNFKDRIEKSASLYK